MIINSGITVVINVLDLGVLQISPTTRILVLHLISLYSIEIIVHAYNYVGILHTMELGLYIPMMSLLKRALGLLEQASWMHPTSSIGELSLAHMCIRCMAIPTPHIISIIWPSRL